VARRINTQGFQHAVPEMAGSTDRDGAFAAEARPECTRPAHRAPHPLQQSLPPCPCCSVRSAVSWPIIATSTSSVCSKCSSTTRSSAFRHARPCSIRTSLTSTRARTRISRSECSPSFVVALAAEIGAEEMWNLVGAHQQACGEYSTSGVYFIYLCQLLCQNEVRRGAWCSPTECGVGTLPCALHPGVYGAASQ